MNHLVKLSCLIPALLVSNGVLAEEQGFYLGVSVGHSSVDAEESDLNATLASSGITATSDIDDSSVGWKVFGGYNLNQYFGAELAYVDLGQIDADVTTTAPFASTGTFDIDTNGVAISAVGRYPVTERFDMFAKVGVFAYDYEITGSITSGVTTVAANEEEDGADVLFGLGAELEITDNIGIRAEWERYTFDDDDADLFSAGIEFDF